jgi:predicted DNA binding CopG/RHH family protein
MKTVRTLEKNKNNTADSTWIAAPAFPKPDDLIRKEDNVKVTLELSKKSIDLFKKYAKKKGFKYQKMIRILVDTYASKTLKA